MIETAVISYLMGAVSGILLHEYLFPEHKTINEISKIKNSHVEGITFAPDEQPATVIKRKGFLRRIFTRKGKI